MIKEGFPDEVMNKIKDKLNEFAGDEYFIEHDGGYTDDNGDFWGDNRLFMEMAGTNTDKISREQYEFYEKIVDETALEKEKYVIYFGRDMGDYDYWTIKSEEPNYIMPTISIKDPNLSDDEIEELFDNLIKLVREVDDKLWQKDIIAYFNELI